MVRPGPRGKWSKDRRTSGWGLAHPFWFLRCAIVWLES
jgi:hypothetical protein